MNPVKILKLWCLAKKLNDAADRGDVTLNVSLWLAPELQALIWQRRVERASARWARAVSDVSLEDWQKACQPRTDMTGDDPS